MVAPLLPGITDSPEQVRSVVEAAIEAGATHVSPILLHLRPVVREEYMAWLAREYPHLVERYEQMYPKAYASKAEQRRVSDLVDEAVETAGGLKPAPRVEAHSRHRGSRPTRRTAKEKRAEQLRLM
jgi:DNA repair photolyase